GGPGGGGGGARLAAETPIRHSAKVRTHVPAGGRKQLAELLVAKVRAGPPGIERQLPERLALVHVADAAADSLVKKQVPEGGRPKRACSSNPRVERKVVGQDIRAEVTDGLNRVSHQFHHRRPKEHGLTIAEFKDGARQVAGASPRLPGLVDMPGASHAQVGVKAPAT